MECGARVSDVLSNCFEVTTGLRQGCAVSSLPFSLYIDGLVEKLRENKDGVRCREEQVPVLLFDDMVILAEGEGGEAEKRTGCT